MFRLSLIVALLSRSIWFPAASHSDDDIVGGYSGFNTQQAMPIARSDMSATLFHAGEVSTSSNARIYLVGGCTSDQYWWEHFHFLARLCFSSCLSATCAFDNTIHKLFLSIKLHFSNILFHSICPCSYKDNGATICYCTEITATCDYFEPDADKWYTGCASAPTARYRHSSAKVNGKIYVAGGRDLNDSVSSFRS